MAIDSFELDRILTHSNYLYNHKVKLRNYKIHFDNLSMTITIVIIISNDQISFQMNFMLLLLVLLFPDERFAF